MNPGVSNFRRRVAREGFHDWLVRRGKKTIRDHRFSVIDEDLDRRTIDNHLQADLSIDQPNRGFMSAREGRMEINDAGVASIHVNHAVFGIVSEFEELVVSAANPETT
jgi:hypothetical protein